MSETSSYIAWITVLGKYRKYEHRQNSVYFHSDTCKYFMYHVHLFSKLSSCYLHMYGWTDTAKLRHASLQVCDVHSVLTPFSWHPSGHSRVQWTTHYVQWHWPHNPKFCMKISSEKVGESWGDRGNCISSYKTVYIRCH